MAVIETGRVTTEPKREFQGESTDVKPMFLTDTNSGSTYFCVDTGDTYIWHIDEWRLI